jgi:wyosine [tRNA(Phe)-imidazoG37] synthetase (radical SAM superfamily)
MTIAFGPVPSRRLGRSLGINNIPPKSCSYSCVYCQVGATHVRMIEPSAFYAPEEILSSVTHQVDQARAAGETIDYLTFVPDGEPTLDENLAETIHMLRPLNIPIAVISNASLIWREDIRSTLQLVDWVSLKVDSIDEQLWRQINRPHSELNLEKILDGIRQFAVEFDGKLVTETMLVAGINDGEKAVRSVADFLNTLDINTSYLAIPTRPPTVQGVHAPDESILNRAYQVFAEQLSKVEYLIGYEGDAFAFSGDVEVDLLNITSVHPMRESAVKDLLQRAQADWVIVKHLVSSGKLKKTEYAGENYFVRSFVAENRE